MTELKQDLMILCLIVIIFFIGLFFVKFQAPKEEYCTPDYCLKIGQTLKQIGVS